MRNIWTIAKREYDNYFNSPLAYVVAFAILLPMGIYFALIMFVSSATGHDGWTRPRERTDQLVVCVPDDLPQPRIDHAPAVR